jgi:hypothetical protein
MSSKIVIEDGEYKKTLQNLWDIEFKTKDMFPMEIAKWIECQAILLGVAPSYIGMPLLVGGAYASQHTLVNAGGLHKEPLILYALVAGRSGNFLLLLKVLF